MLDQVNSLFGIIPDHDLDIIAPNQTLAQITTRALSGFSDFLDETEASAVVVQGDTTTTLAAALASFYLKIPVVHVEAGLRTGNRHSPFPEEINRRLTTELTNLHLAPTLLSRENLLNQGVAPRSIHVTGNTVIDALQDVAHRNTPTGDPAIDEAIQTGRRLLLVTAHRRESWGEAMAGVGRAIGDVARRFPDLLVVLPAHRNPTVRDRLLPPLNGLENVIVTEPMSYAPFATVIRACTLVLTDSGGLQEEAPSLGKPVLVMRDTTERPEALHAGTAALVGTDPSAIVAAVSKLLTDPDAYRAMAQATNPYGDGFAAARSVAAIESLLGLGDPLPDFVWNDPVASAR